MSKRITLPQQELEQEQQEQQNAQQRGGTGSLLNSGQQQLKQKITLIRTVIQNKTEKAKAPHIHKKNLNINNLHNNVMILLNSGQQ